MTDILKVSHLTKEFGRLRAVDDLTFEVKEGEILGVIGPNGAGKTTVFNLLTGAFKPDNGNILFKGKDISYDSPAKRCHHGLGRTYQIPRPFDRFVLEVVAERPVPQHLEKRMVIRIPPDLLQVVMLARDPNAFLAVHRPRVRSTSRRQKNVLKLVHSRVREHQRRIIVRHHRG